MAIRRVHALDLWMNGLYVGQWQRVPGSPDKLRYDAAWMDAPERRPLSLSLPFTRGADLRGSAVAAISGISYRTTCRFCFVCSSVTD